MATTENATTARRFFSSIVGLLQPGTASDRRTSRNSTSSAYNDEKDGGGAESGLASQRSNREIGGTEDDVDWDLKAENLDRRRWARTLPPWVHSLKVGESQDIIDPNAALLPRVPEAARGAHHNHMPIPKPRSDGSSVHERSRETVAMAGSSPDQVSRWQAFARASAYPGGNSRVVDEEWMRENLPDFDRPWTPVLPSEKEQEHGLWFLNAEQRKLRIEHFRLTLMRNPFVPLLFRLTVMAFCAAALSLGAGIYHESDNLNSSPSLEAGTSVPSGTDDDDYICEQQTSTYMAFIVNTFAILYLFYITWDEYTSKPLGLRRTRAKMRLLFLDLFFIVFSAGDLSLAFDTLTDQQWSCFQGNPLDANTNNAQAARSTCVYSSDLCNRQKGLVSVLLVAEVAWLLTFALSVMRILERVSL